MNAFKSIGTKLVGATIAAGLVAGAAFAGTGSTFTVNLPNSVSVGDAVLPSGEYKVSEFSMNDGSMLFVFRSDKGEATSALAMKNAEPAFGQKTEMILSNQKGTLHLDKMFIEGDSAGYQFAESR